MASEYDSGAGLERSMVKGRDLGQQLQCSYSSSWRAQLILRTPVQSVGSRFCNLRSLVVPHPL